MKFREDQVAVGRGQAESRLYIPSYGHSVRFRCMKHHMRYKDSEDGNKCHMRQNDIYGRMEKMIAKVVKLGPISSYYI
ncbi:MAG: hypothetical protein A2Y72_04855 [Chloroflexi bacterium RBG_13_53_26]|nr:MAG: hypothetical protein A2Y72_04855 [Chloroflexi bacterium RBG_13_53_26]